MQKNLIRAFALVSLMATALPTLAQTTLLGDTIQNSSTSYALSTAGLGEKPQSGVDALWINDLEDGLAVTPLLLGDDAFEGSAFLQTLTVTAGSTASFDWVLDTDTFAAGFLDRAFVVINNSVVTLAEVAASPVSGSFSHTFKTAGTYRFGVGVVDVIDVDVVSFLNVSNLTVQVSAVPEPSSVLLMLVGLAGIGAVARKRRA